MAYLWGHLEGDQPNGTFIKLPAGFKGKLHSTASTFRAVVIQGQIQYSETEAKTTAKNLVPGSYFGSKGDWTHHITADEDQETILYIRSEGSYQLLN